MDKEKKENVVEKVNVSLVIWSGIRHHFVNILIMDDQRNNLFA